MVLVVNFHLNGYILELEKFFNSFFEKACSCQLTLRFL